VRRRYRRTRRHFGIRRDPAPVLLVTEDQRGAILVLLGRLLWRYRSELAPLWTGLLLAAVAAWAHTYHPGAALPLAALTVAVAGLSARPPAALARRWAPLGRPAERAYTAGTVALAGGWLAAAVAWGPSPRPLPTLALLGTVVTGLPWWFHRRRRARVRVERTIEAWPQFADAIGLAGSRLTSATVNRWGWTGRLALRRGQTAQQATGQAAAVESALGVRPGAVRIEPDPHRADRAVLRVVETEPHAAPIPWPARAAGSILSAASPVGLGLFEDGSPVLLRLLYRNTLIGGVIGSGKSGVLNVILAMLAASPDVELWGIDLKGGMELRPWAARLGRLATNPSEAVALLADAAAVVRHRADRQAEHGRRLWQPSREAPALVVAVDEYAELPDDAHPHADSVARLGRAVAVTLLAATQRPTQKAMGYGAVRSQMDNRLCLRVRERRDADLVLGQGMYAAGWRPDLLDAPGKLLISAPEHTVPRPARAYLMTDADVEAVAAAHATTRPVPIEPPDEPTGPVLHLPPRNHGTDPDRALIDALTAAVEGVTVPELVAATGRSRRWVYYRLRSLAVEGRAEQTEHGGWRATGPGDHGS
jgi:DNA segregation ATPase FtsK/SpoIIIE, S-DNA-T family